MLVRLSLACGKSCKLQRRATPLGEDRWRESLRRLVRRLELKTEPVPAWSGEVAAPVLVGVLKPMILLPVALATRLSTEQAEAVLTHELAHLRRHDQWILLAQRLLETVLFYHPAVWWLSAQLSRAREQACNDLVLASGARPADYAEALVLCSELRRTGAGLGEEGALQLAATGNRGTSLRRRVLRVLGQDDPIRPGKAGWIVARLCVFTIVLTGAGLVTPVEAQRPEERTEEPGTEEEALLPAEDLPVADPKSNSIWDDPAISDAAKKRLYKKVASDGHVVKADDTLASISRRYDVSEKTLRALNPGIAKGLKVGQKVVIYGAQLRVEFVIAEVPAAYKMEQHWMTKEMLEEPARDGESVHQGPGRGPRGTSG